MAQKKKRRYRRNKRVRRQINNTHDRHHLCWTRRKWGTGYLCQLRLHHYCIVAIPRDTLHRYIHSEMCFIPIPEQNSAKFALEHLGYLESVGAISDNDPIEKRLKVLAALFDCTDQKTADAFREQLRIVSAYKTSLL